MSPSERERIRAQVRESRQRQGLPEHVQDTTVLDRLAGRLLAEDPQPFGTGLPSGRNTDRNENGRPVRRPFPTPQNPAAEVV